jgi:hypothetical protein
MPNRQLQHLDQRRVNRLPLPRREQIAPPGRMDPRQMQNLRRIQIANTCHGPLVEQRHFDRPAARAQPPPHFVGGEASASGPRDRSPRRCANCRSVSSRTEPSPRRSQYQICRIGPFAMSSRNRKCSTVGGSATRTSPVIRGSKISRSPLSSRSTTRFPTRPTSSIRRPTTRRASAAPFGSIAIGRRGHSTRSAPAIVQPSIPAIPRRIVSTSGSSGTVAPSRGQEPGDS